MTRWMFASVGLTLLLVLLVILRLAANALAHIGLDGNPEAFVAAMRWYTVRDIAFLMLLYGVALAILFRRRPRG